jgi:hypothetical protein
LLGWDTYLEWIEDMVKQQFDGNPGGRRRTSRHRLRWLDDVAADLRTMGIKRWRLIREDRTE